MVGPLIYGFSEDAVAAAKVVADFAKTNDKLVIKGGAYAGKALDADGVKTLAAVPSKEVLLAQLLGLMQSPISRLARVLAAVAESKAEPAAA
jgi:large subunit ribosomal protein L10